MQTSEQTRAKRAPQGEGTGSGMSSAEKRRSKKRAQRRGGRDGADATEPNRPLVEGAGEARESLREQRRAERLAEKSERRAEKQAERAEKQAQKEAERAEKRAEKEAERAEKQAQKEAERAEKQAQKEAERAEKRAEKEAERAEKQAEKPNDEAPVKVAPAQEDPVTAVEEGPADSGPDGASGDTAEPAIPPRPEEFGEFDLSTLQLHMALPSDPMFSSQWHLYTGSGYDINVADVWDDYTGQGVTVSVYDQGVDSSHSDLNDNFDFANQYSTVTQATDGRPVGSGDNHGTAVAGLIGAEQNGEGVVGAAYDSTLVAIYDPLSGTSTDFANRLELGYAHAAGFDVSNHSWGYGNAFYSTPNAAFLDNFNSATWADAGTALESAGDTGRGSLGTVFVQSAGNSRLYGDDVNLHNFQNSRYTVTVAATEQDGDITTYSTEGAAEMIAAPGSPLAGTIATTDRTGSAGYSGTDYTTGFNGTSAAAPIVSGVVALMLEANPNLGWRDVQEILVYSAQNSDPGSGSWQTNGAGDWNGGGLTMSHDFGAGLIDAHAAVRLAEVWTTQKASANEQSQLGSASPSIAVPDGGGASSYATSTINMGGGLDIDHVEVDLNISHTWIGDLYVTLTSPDGTTSVLMDRAGVGSLSTYGSSQDNVDFTFSSTQHWGEDGAGTWTLQVHDYVSGESGTLNNWTLRLYGDTATSDDSFIYTDEFGSFTGDAGRKTLTDTGGTDTLNAAAVSTAVSIDLNGGGTSTIAGNTVTIAGGTTIENALGGDGADTLTGNAGANALSGGRGDDTLVGGAGADVLTSGAGTDTASYAGAGSAVTVNLGDAAGYAGDAAGDSYSGVENVTGSAYADTIRGDAGNNTLNGGAGGDWLHGDAGSDTLIGGDGTDWLSLTDSAASVAVDLGLGSGSLGDAAGDSYSSIENVWGSAYADTLTGDAGANWLYGGAGADALDGGAGGDVASYSGSGAGVTVNLAAGTGTGGEAEGDTLSNMESVRASEYNDVLTGTAVRNWLFGAGGNDLINGGAGDDALDGGSGTDSVSYSGSTAGVTVDLAAGTGTGGHAEGDTLAGFENVLGSSHDDTISGDSGANILRGQDGDDSLVGGAGGDTLDGGSGSDTVSYAASAAGVTVDLEQNSASGGDAAGDSFLDVENLVGSAQADSLTGDGNANTLTGGAGGDVLTGGGGTDTASYAGSAAGVTVSLATGTGTGGDAEGDSLSGIENLTGSANADSLTGDTGDNLLDGGAGSDALAGGGGTDTATYAGSSAGVTVDLEAGTGIGGDAAGDTLSAIENLTGSGFDDSLTGDGAANVLDGADGEDTLVGGAGGDTLTGGAGTDTASYAGSSAGVTVSLASGTGTGGDAEGDSLAGIENLTGSANADSLTGDGGDDALNGGAGTDTVSYAAAAAGVALSLAAGTGTGGDAAGDSFTAIENVTGSGHDDSLTGDGGANTLSGGDGNDTLIGGAGADTLDGGAGTDTVSYAGASQAVTVDLGAGTAWGGDATGDSFSDIENVTGTDHNDKLTGDSTANVLDGGSGNDWIVGSAGSDTLSGGDGVDWLSYANATAGVTLSLGAGSGTGGDAAGDTLSGFEHIWGSAYDDNLTGDDGNNWFVGGAGADHFDGGVGIGDTVSYSTAAVGITVDLGAGTGTGGDAQGDTFANIEHIRATEHDDVLTGSSGKNWLFGAGGNDTLMGGDGGDSLYGGTGIDTVTYAGAATWIGVDLLKGTGWNGDARYDTYSNVENIIGSDNGDTLKGDHGANVITGGLGNDWITGNGGADTIQGGDGTDWATYIGASAAVSVSLATGSGTQGDANGDTLSSIENLWGSDHDDTLTGDSGSNWLYGGADADTLDGGGDTVSFAGSAAGVTVNLATGTGSGGDAAGDSYTSIEHVRASANGDTITGTSGNNWLFAAQGNDTIHGGLGNDTLVGGAGNDTYTFDRGDGADILDNRGYAADSDRLVLGTGIDHDQLWFHQNGNDLVVSVIGEDGTVTVDDWFNGSSNTVSSVETSAGDTLTAVGVANLVSAMSAFSPPTGPDENMDPTTQAALAVDLAANWDTGS